MIALDTNVLVRILVDNPGQPAQVDAARALASRAKQVFVPLVVQIEPVWVLESGYALSKEAVVQALEHLEVNQAFVLEDEGFSAGVRWGYFGPPVRTIRTAWFSAVAGQGT